jgi:uncharacterized caspase-like protein
MELVFRKFTAETATPGIGEIYLSPAASADRQRRDLAALLLDKGPSALQQGAAPAERIVVSVDPTLDDMLAAAIVQRQLRGDSVSPGCKAFAHYVGLVREGLRPGQFPLEQSIEGIYLAIRAEAEQDKAGLENPETARRFLTNWERMASVVFRAADAGHDPFTMPLFTAGSEFARERAFLAKDLDVYRLDFAHGEAWQVQLPGFAARMHGLLLRRPKALLFKYWTRMQCPAPLNGPYPFLAVDWGNGQWIFSTDPVQKIALKPLADLLQASELRQNPSGAEADAWFDGKPFQFTLVAAPRGGSKMPAKTVRRIVKTWCRARPLVAPTHLPRYMALLACVMLAVGWLLWYTQIREPALIDVYDLNLFAVGVSEYEKIGHLPAPDGDVDALAEAFKKQEGKLFKKVHCQTLKSCNTPRETRSTRANILRGLQEFLLEGKDPERSLTSRSLVIVMLSGHGYIEASSKMYHFAPVDYDPRDVGATGLYLADLQRYLGTLPCSVIVVLDTCKSGGAAPDEEASENEAFSRDIEKYVSDSRKRLMRGEKGLVVIAACGPEQFAMEHPRWKHGALTLALLEGIKGEHGYNGEDPPFQLPHANGSGVVTLQEMDRYMTKRVEQLTAELHNPRYRGQMVNTHFTGNVAPVQIPIAQRQ